MSIATKTPLLSIKDAAKRMGLHADTVRDMLETRTLTYVQFGPKSRRIPESSINALIAQRTVRGRV